MATNQKLIVLHLAGNIFDQGLKRRLGHLVQRNMRVHMKRVRADKQFTGCTTSAADLQGQRFNTNDPVLVVAMRAVSFLVGDEGKAGLKAMLARDLLVLKEFLQARIHVCTYARSTYARMHV